MTPALREALSRTLSRVIGSPFAKPIARVTLAIGGLFLLAFIGRTAVAGALGTGPAQVPSPAVSVATGAIAAPAADSAAALTARNRTSEPGAAPATEGASAASAGVPAAVAVEALPVARSPASPDNPVFLNTAGVDDLRRLPGIGEKRASAILALRAHLGRFHAIEDLLKVKGIGRATLKRLRPVVRLDPPPLPDAGSGAPR